ncbi:HEAT repeat-containing protein 3 [Habropoda laboriosa]|uniref:HEAT repeat-containing protein 3 n=1 Tax=Habropoda laboriosa TaxID=597456 RepID=A0A0L7RCT1_9HYME|nr:PREDICTED: HEAT repeat-containing protein 3 [Habropoda laboriosa]KOC68595.1 HEAT repeat-containing protein 3 [Habropoda laboriosa]
MGKQKRQRRKPHKENPTGLMSVKDFEAEEAEYVTNKDRENALQRVYEEIQSANVEEKLSGLQTLESMSYDSSLAIEIAKNGIAKMIGPLLVDQNVVVRSGSASALRYIAENGQIEAHTSLLKDDIMTPLCFLLKQYSTHWQPKFEQKEKGKGIDEKEAFIQSIILLWTLCEHNEYAVKRSNEEDLVSVLTKFFDIATFGIEIVTIIVQCLLSLSEDNSAAVKKLKVCEYTLIQLLNIEVSEASISETICLKTAISGLLINMTNCTENNSTICKVINVLSDTLSVDCKQLLSSLTSILPHEKNTFSSSARKKVQENRRIFTAQQQALEILANLCSEDQEDENDSYIDDSDCEAEGIDDVLMNDKLYKTIGSVPLEVVEVFNSCNIVKKVWDKTRAVDEDTVEILLQNIEGIAVLKQMQKLKCRAYLCLNNLITSLEIDVLGGVENLYRMWVDIGTVIFNDTSSYNIELLEAATSTMRAAIQKLSEEKANIFNRLTLADVTPILSEGRQCPNTNVRVNLIRILGNLALILTNNDTLEAREIIKHVSWFLLETCKLESKVWIMAESLDAIMDIYAEDDSDQLANEFKLLEKLHGVVPLFKNKVKQQRESLGDNVAVVSTVNTNITRFVKYKEKRMKDL